MYLDTIASLSPPHTSYFSNASSCLREIQRQRKLRVLKLFTGLTIAFFVFWIPLYAIMFRVKFYYTKTYTGSLIEQHLIHTMIPLSQLLGSCNSCVNPVLYALLNQKFRESCKLGCSWCSSPATSSIAVATRDDNHSVAVVVAARNLMENTAV